MGMEAKTKSKIILSEIASGTPDPNEEKKELPNEANIEASEADKEDEKEEDTAKYVIAADNRRNTSRLHRRDG